MPQPTSPSRPELFDHAISLPSLRAAYSMVRERSGPPGIDKETPAAFGKDLDAQLQRLHDELQSGQYRCMPLLRFQLKKKQGGQRPLGICAVRDRVVQRAILAVLTPLFEQIFLDCSHAYRHDRSPHTALQQIEAHRKDGLLWAYEADIEDCFGSVRAELLAEEIHKVCGDARMDRLILRHVQTGVLQRGAKDRTHLGIPQGSPLSPLLANIYLHPFDQALQEADLALVRYADDLIILTRTEADAKQAGDLAEAALRERRMRPNPDKTRIVDLHEGISFLGFSIDHRGERPSDKAIQGLLQLLEEERNEHKRGSSQDRIAAYKSIIQGWRSYFRSFGAFAPEDPEMALAAAEIALKKGDQEDAQRFVSTIQIKHHPTLEEEINNIRRQCGLPPQPAQMQEIISETKATVTQATGTTKIPLTSQAAPTPDEDAFLANAVKALRKFRQEKEEERRQAAVQGTAKEDDAAARIKQLRRKIHLDPAHFPLYEALAEEYAQSGLYMLAESILQQAKERQSQGIPTTQIQIKEELDARDTDAQETDAPPVAQAPQITIHKELPTLPDIQPLDEQEAIMERYLDLFQGREGILAQAQIHGDGKIQYQAVSRHLNEQTLREHLDGKVAYALFPIDEQGESLIGGLDVDLTKRVLRAHMNDPDAMAARLEEARAWSLQLTQILQTMGIHVLLEESGFKGFHIWFFLEQPMQARRIRSFLRTILNEAPEPPSGVVAELIPDRDHLHKHDTGHAIKLPLGIHPGSGRRAYFYSTTTGLAIDTSQALHEIQRTPIKLLEALLLEHRHGIGLDNLDSRFPQAAKLLESCGILRRLIKKLEEVRHLNHHERLTLLYSLGQLPEEGEPIIHAAIGLCYDYDHAITQDFVRQVRPFPISCPRLREKHGDLLDGSQCNCYFPKMTKEAYPTPLLHVIPMHELFPKEEPTKKASKATKQDQSAPKNRKTKAVKSKQSHTEPKEDQPEDTREHPPEGEQSLKESRDRLHDLLHKLIAQRRHLRGIQRSVDRISEELAEIFDQREIDEFETDIGLLIRAKRADGQWEWDIDI